MRNLSARTPEGQIADATPAACQIYRRLITLIDHNKKRSSKLLRLRNSAPSSPQKHIGWDD